MRNHTTSAKRAKPLQPLSLCNPSEASLLPREPPPPFGPILLDRRSSELDFVPEGRIKTRGSSTFCSSAPTLDLSTIRVDVKHRD